MRGEPRKTRSVGPKKERPVQTRQILRKGFSSNQFEKVKEVRN